MVLNLAQPLSIRPNVLPLSSSEGGHDRGCPKGVAPSRVPAQRAGEELFTGFDDRFERGLKLILRGMEQSLPRRR
ncbi:hypothetical protein D187_001600 [Cystobacter fuscus DSM 2262]|uniref:Uncharacterized protein n=1 Tax=Cystobacter fuscus (strain ATCC 25194 / DSM 2262 / NBRC 100088 / M29) TaxID=1242864 RepID=S9QW90_CYSF2|nr:hypothetical protein D187_001600 [Cystobacter fuscus DSM 2262]